MLTLHQYLDRIFKKRLSFSIFVRIWLTFAFIVLLSLSLALYGVQKTLKPSAKRVVEDSLVDSAHLLASLVASDVANLPKDKLNQSLSSKLAHAFATPNQAIWYNQKSQSSYHLYITDRQGVVIYDSHKTSVGQDFAHWNDVYLTLQGNYGARSTDMDGHSVMYVASPIVADGVLVGVLSLGKPTQTLSPYLAKSAHEITSTIIIIVMATLIIATLMAWWLRHSINSINRYTLGLASDAPPHFYLGRELNELLASIHTMKETIENKAYVNEYVHTLTHELKSPLTAIRASAEILSSDLTDDERQQFTHIISGQVDKLTDLVDKLLTLAKIEQPTFKLSPTKVNLGWVIENCLNQQCANLKKHNTTVAVKQSDLIVIADQFWISQALQNVINNAIYYGISFIDIDIHQDNTDTIILIQNDSPPLDDFVIERAFERYFSMGNLSMGNTTQKSTGLGLTLVKQVIERHGGTVSLTQNVCDKTNVVCLKITLPQSHF